MATDVYRAPEMRHRAGERHHSIWEGSGGAGMPLWKGWDGGAGREGSCPLSPSLAEGPWAVSCTGKFGLVRGFASALLWRGPGSLAQHPGSASPWLRNLRAVCCELGGPGPGTATFPVSPKHISAPPRAARSCSWGRSQQLCHGAAGLLLRGARGNSQFCPQPPSTERQAGSC